MKDENVVTPLAAELAPATLKGERRKPIVFAKRDKKAAVSGADSSLSSSTDLKLVLQEDLELWILRWNDFREVDDSITLLLSRGAPVQEGVHTAKLVPWRDETGRTYLKTLVR